MHKLAPNNIMHPARSIDTDNQQWISRAGDDERSKDLEDRASTSGGAVRPCLEAYSKFRWPTKAVVPSDNW
jgi:hypothetical protein